MQDAMDRLRAHTTAFYFSDDDYKNYKSLRLYSGTAKALALADKLGLR